MPSAPLSQGNAGRRNLPREAREKLTKTDEKWGRAADARNFGALSIRDTFCRRSL